MAALLATLVSGISCSPPPIPEPPVLSAVDTLRGTGADGDGGFARALVPRPFGFPADHGPHPDFAVEWWYYTGNLAADDGRRFGFQLTFFRRALAPPAGPADAPRASAWASRQLYLAHFALSNLDGGSFHAAERVRRGALELAGARAEPFAVWLEDWQATSVPRDSDARQGDEARRARAPDDLDTMFPLRLVAQARDTSGRAFGIDLTLESGKPIVLQGDRGLSSKGSRPGNASYYYSRTRMPTNGTVSLGSDAGPARGEAEGESAFDGQTIAVSGTSWMDREWSTSVLESEQIGWDWFSLQLDDGTEVMAFELRRSDGTVDAASHGTWVAQDGTSTHLSSNDFHLDVLERWQSPFGTVYPAGWRLRVPSQNLDLAIRPVLAQQELDLSFRYWEGAVEVTAGTAAGSPIGRGYVELVGYAESFVREAPPPR